MSKCRSRLDSATGFTLIELLVVISIIAILVALLLPALAKSRQQVRLIDCANRSRQMGAVMHMYNVDFNEWWPTPYGQGGVSSYRTVIPYYTGVERLSNSSDWHLRNPMICPSNYSLDAPHTLFWGGGGYPMYDGVQQGTGTLVASYAMNPYFYEGGYGGVPANEPRRGTPRRASHTLLFVDAWRETRVHYWYVSNGKSFMRFRHNETAQGASDGQLNMTYADGHVKTWRYEVGNEIYPTGGNGLFTRQQGFVWSPMP